MRKIILTFSILLLITSCSKEEENEDVLDKSASIGTSHVVREIDNPNSSF